MPHDLHHDDYFRPDSLERALGTSFSQCIECRACASLCPSLALLMEVADQEDASPSSAQWPEAMSWEVVERCFGCGTCTQRCPYAPHSGGDLDIAALLQRAKAVDAKQRLPSLLRRIQSRPDRVGRVASVAPRLVSALLRSRAGRALLAQGTERDVRRPLAAPARESFPAWLKREAGVSEPRTPIGTVALFACCTYDYFEPGPAMAATRVLWRNGWRVIRPPLACCGAPGLALGELDDATGAMRHNVEVLRGHVDQGNPVVTLEPRCTEVLRTHAPALLGDMASKRLGDRVVSFPEFMVQLHAEGRLALDFRSGMGRVAAVVPPSGRVHHGRWPVVELMRLLPATTPVGVERLIPDDGVVGMSTASFEATAPWFDRLRASIEAIRPDTVVLDSSEARRALLAHGGPVAIHGATALASAYGLTRPSSEG